MPPLTVRCARTIPSPSPARAFIRILCASSPSTFGSSNSASILDILLPPRTRAFHTRNLAEPAALRIRPRSIRAQSHNGHAATIAAVVASIAQRSFSAATPWRKTQVIYNPQRDEDGKEMLLEITPRAANRLSKLMADDKNPNLALRISVESGGCHGFQSLISLTSLPPTLPSSSSTTTTSNQHPPETSTTPPKPATEGGAETAAHVAPSTTTSASPTEPSIGEDDTIFAFVKDGDDDATGTTGMPKVIADAPSLELLKGSKVDFAMELIGSQFKIVDNPHATSACGCGTSFDIKF